MKIIINGESRQVSDVTTVADLVRLLGYEGKRIAIERNGLIVPKSEYEQVVVEEGDGYEIVVAVGGG